eukprot:tig00020848_g14563.t1
MKNAERSAAAKKRGSEAYKLGARAEAAELFSEALRYAPDTDAALADGAPDAIAVLYANRAACLLATGASVQAARDARRALDRAPTYAKALVRRAKARLNLGDAAGALQDLSRARQFCSEGDREALDADLAAVSALASKGAPVQASQHAQPQPSRPLLELERPNPLLASASDAVRVEVDARAGRHLLATRTIRAGEAVVCEEPYAWCLALDRSDDHCPACLRRCLPGGSPVPCRVCAAVLYCDEACRDADGPMHDAECPGQLPASAAAFLSSLRASKEGEDVLLALRVMRRAFLAGQAPPFAAADPPPEGSVAGCGAAGRYGADYRAASALQTHEASGPPERAARFAALASDACRALSALPYLARGTESELAVARHAMQMRTNVHSVQGEEEEGAGAGVVRTRMVTRGRGVYLTAALLNHSCSPNTSLSFEGRRLVLRAAKDIEAGEEVTSCYGPQAPHMPRAERRAALAAQYHFDCRCGACGAADLSRAFLCPCGAPLDAEDRPERCGACGAPVAWVDLQRTAQAAGASYTRARQLLDGGGAGQTEEEAAGAAEALLGRCIGARAGLLHPLHRELGAARDARAEALARLGRWHEAAEELAASLQCLERGAGLAPASPSSPPPPPPQLLFNAGPGTGGRSRAKRGWARLTEGGAASPLQRALESNAALLGPGHPAVAELREMQDVIRSYR